MEFTLIPFALREADQRFVGVGDVAAGLACGCICPSCKSRLIARKGAIKVWHFAHASRADGQQTETDCDYRGRFRCGSWPDSWSVMDSISNCRPSLTASKRLIRGGR